ncbi:unnamed protein product [Camellia sinensis]
MILSLFACIVHDVDQKALSNSHFIVHVHEVWLQELQTLNSVFFSFFFWILLSLMATQGEKNYNCAWKSKGSITI